MKILCFGASNSKHSINKKLAAYTATLIPEGEVEVLDLNDYEMSIYSIDREQTDGVPQKAIDFNQKVREADAIVVSFAEHNGSYTTAFKNVLDWMSRIKDTKKWDDKQIFALSTSPGGRGGANVLEAVCEYFPHMGAKVEAQYSLPRFYDSFQDDKGIIDMECKEGFDIQVAKFVEAIKAK